MSYGVFTWDRDELTPVWTQTGMKILQPFTWKRDEMLSGQNDMFCQINISLTQKHTGLKFLDPVWDLLSLTWERRTVGTQPTGTRISRRGPATETKSDRSEFIVRPVSCKRIKRNVWSSIRTHAGLSSSRSHVDTPLVSVKPHTFSENDRPERRTVINVSWRSKRLKNNFSDIWKASLPRKEQF